MLWRCQFVGYSDLMFGWNSKLDTSFVIQLFLKIIALFEKHNLDVIEHRFCFWLTGYFVFVWALCSTQMHTFDNEKYSKRFKLYKNRVEQVQSSTRRKKSFRDFKRFYEVFFQICGILVSRYSMEFLNGLLKLWIFIISKGQNTYKYTKTKND